MQVNIRDPASIPGSGRSPGGVHSNPLQYPCLENPMDRGSWWVTVHGVAKSQTRLKWLKCCAHAHTRAHAHTHTHTHTHTHLQGTSQTVDWGTLSNLSEKNCPETLAWGEVFRSGTHFVAYGTALKEHRLQMHLAFSLCLAPAYKYQREKSIHTHLGHSSLWLPHRDNSRLSGSCGWQNSCLQSYGIIYICIH